MKKFFSFVLMFAALTVNAATQYCGEATANENFTFSLMNVGGNSYRVQLDAVGADKFDSPYNINCGVNQSAGAGIFLGGENASNWVITDDCAYIEFETATDASVPTGFYGNYFCFNKKGGGLIEISNFNPSDIDWTATCSSGGEKSDPELSLNETAVELDATNSATFQIVATRKGDGAISFESNKPGIASVSADGLVTAVGRGTASITVRVAESETYKAASKKLTVTVTGPINWDGLDWVAGSDEKFKVAAAEGQGVVNVQQPGFATEPGIYTTFQAGVSSCSLGDKCAIDGAGVVLYLSAFTNKVTVVTVVDAVGTYEFSVFYVDGTEATAIDVVKEGTRARKVIENGNVVIIRDGVKFNILGSRL